MGSQGESTISAEEVAGKAGTISWHVFTGITARVTRIAVEG
ncbi:MAG: alanine racemase C-terminal domain-containing protein [Verrucomicrobium sp.]